MIFALHHPAGEHHSVSALSPLETHLHRLGIDEYISLLGYIQHRYSLLLLQKIQNVFLHDAAYIG